MRRPLRGMWLAIAASVTIQTSAATAKAADDRERVWARAELGAEYDDNVHRAETIKGATDATPTVGSALARGVVSLSTSSLLSHGQDVTFSILGAGKLFLADAARNENVYVVDNAGAWRIATDPRGKIGVGLNYYEATQAGTPTERALSGGARDFRSIVPTLRLARSLADSHTVGLAAGYRWFVYKPLRDYDFRAPVVAVEYRFSRETEDGTADWDLLATAGLELRRFAGGRVVNDTQPCGTSQPCLPIFDPGGARHQDQFITGEVSVTRTGRVLVGAGYAIQWNRSNSLSESLVRHVGIVRLTAPLPLDIYLAARAELVYATYPDGIRLAMGPSGQQSASIEDETRSHLRAELSRNLSAHLQLVGRYSFYANALGNGVGDYRRQTASLSLLYTTE